MSGVGRNTWGKDSWPTVLEQIEKIAKWIPEVGLCDRGYRGRKQVNQTKIIIPDSKPKGSISSYEKLKQRKRFRKRAGIEGVIGHLKADHRLERNYLSGFLGDEINVLMAAAAFNFRKWLLLFYCWLKKIWQTYQFNNLCTA